MLYYYNNILIFYIIYYILHMPEELKERIFE